MNCNAVWDYIYIRDKMVYIIYHLVLKIYWLKKNNK